VIVLDTSTLVGAASRRGSTPHRAALCAIETGMIALSDPVTAELLGVLHRPRLSSRIDPAVRAELLAALMAASTHFAPEVAVRDCRDPDDNIYLELPLAASAHTIVSSDLDLLVLHPWRGVRILRPADFLALP
jgi:putative PIN family toxin of toxin-antitoxin system